jgi:hypothetical protein
LVLFGTLGGLGTALSGPAVSWAQKLPTGIPKLEERLSFLSRPIAAFQKFADQAQGLTLGGEAKAVPVAVQGSTGYRSSWWSASLLRLCLERGGLTRSGRWRLSGFWSRKAVKRGRVRNAVVADIIENRHLQRS